MPHVPGRRLKVELKRIVGQRGFRGLPCHTVKLSLRFLCGDRGSDANQGVQSLRFSRCAQACGKWVWLRGRGSSASNTRHEVRGDMETASASRVSAVLVILLATWCCVAARQFTIDYENNTFLKDGEPFRLVTYVYP